MQVINIHWLCKSAYEAELIISDGRHRCIVFCHPCNIVLNQEIHEPLYANDVENLMVVKPDERVEKIKRLDEDYFAQHFLGKVHNVENGIIKIGGLLIKLERPFTFWVQKGDFVEFKSGRLDL